MASGASRLIVVGSESFMPSMQIVAGWTGVVAGIGSGLLIAAAAPPALGVIRHVMFYEGVSTPGREAVMVMVELPPGAASGRHTHPAEVFAFVLRFAPTFEAVGQPPRAPKVGDVFRMRPNKVHQAINGGDVRAAARIVPARRRRVEFGSDPWSERAQPPFPVRTDRLATGKRVVPDTGKPLLRPSRRPSTRESCETRVPARSPRYKVGDRMLEPQ
jgi:quercetin dioxygenase-like cupin family protein